MPKRTIIADRDTPGERELVEAWLERWRDRLDFVSDNYGCGCCVDIYDVDGPPEAFAELPVLRSDAPIAPRDTTMG